MERSCIRVPRQRVKVRPTRRPTALAAVGLLIVTLCLTVVAPASAGALESIWSSTTNPTTSAFTGDSASVELGVKITPNVDGTIEGLKFYKGATNTGTHVGHLWTSGGTKLAEATFTGETASGWQTVTLATPIAVTAGTTYVASYLAPVGNYAYDSASQPGSLTNAVSSSTGNLTAPGSVASGGNGVFAYTSSPSGAFPNGSAGGGNYWVDAVFNPGGVAPPPPPATSLYGSSAPANADGGDAASVNLGIQFQSTTAGYVSGIRFYKSAANTGTHVGSLWTAQHTLLAQATFTSETGSGWQDVKFADMVPVAANTTYIASYFAPNGHYAYTAGGLTAGFTNSPLVALPSSTPGGNGVYSYGSVPQVPITASSGADYGVDFDFTPTYVAPTATQPTPRTGTTGAGSVLVLTDPTNPFSDNLCSNILVTKGIACARTDTGNLTAASVLTPYKTVILADGAALTAAQLTLVTNWTNNGGNFIAMRPAANLNTLLGLGARSDILPDAYLKIDTTQAPGLGTSNLTLQYHGVADLHALAGARAVATLYSNATTATTFPAVTTKASGSGTASAWLFDLSRSNIYTRQGNPGLAGQVTTSSLAPGGPALPRVMDRFGLGYLDVSKASIPQADLQVALLGNQIEQTKFPVPVKWNFPSYKPGTNHPNGFLKAAFVLTGDDHASNSQTLARFAAETAASPTGCSVAAWTCITSTSYAFPGAFSDATAKPYTDKGFEVSPHISDAGSCATNWTPANLDANIVTPAINAWATSFPTIAAAHPPVSQRFHCYGAFNDYATVATAEKAHGMTADTSTSCWPQQFVTGVCEFTGSNLPQQYTDANGGLTGNYQYVTQATDENPGSISASTLSSLITGATGSNGYYGYFTVLAHLDNHGADSEHADSTQAELDVRSVAAANDVPVISGSQAQAFTAGRAATTVSAPTYATSTVTFTVGSPVANLMLMQPTKYGAKTLSTVKRGSTTLTITTQTVNGISYAVFPVGTAGTYTVTYA